MAYDLIWTSEAENWLREIFEFIASDNAEAALGVVQGILTRAKTLSSFPNAGYLYHQRTSEEIRILLYGHYRIAYKVQVDTVVILGVFHGALEIEKYLR